MTPDTGNPSSAREWLPEIRANMPGGIDPQADNAILHDKGSNPILIRLDGGVGFSVDAHEGDLVFAELIAQSIAQ